VTWAKLKLICVRLKIALMSVQDRCMVSTECTTAWKSFWAQPMVLLGDVCQVEACFGPFGDSVSLGYRSVNGLRQMYHGHGNISMHTRWYFLVTLVKWKLISDHLEIVLISTQDRCMVSTECTTAWKSFWA
jgi:hypothetical protein